MPVRNYAHQYTVEIKDERKSAEDHSFSDSSSELEDRFPLIQQNLARSKVRNSEQIHKKRINFVSLLTDLMTKNKRRNWRRLLAVGLIAIVVLALVITAAILLTGSPNSSGSKPTTAAGISLEEWLHGSLSTKSFNGTWMSDDEILYRDEKGNMLVYNVTSRKSKVILDTKNEALAASFDHQISADHKYMLLASSYQKLYRHTYLAHYKIVNLETLKEFDFPGHNDSVPLQLVAWSPKGNSLVYVYQNNIFYRPAAEGAEDYQITSSGVFGSVYNGVPDWVYEEEVFSSNKALWFSPSGTKLAFGYFDDKNTPIMNIPFYGYPGSMSFQYTSVISIHYPKSGTTNPTAKLFYVDLEDIVKNNGSTPVEIESPPHLKNRQTILSAVDFPTDNLLSATWMNRVQNEAYFHLCDVVTQNCTTVLSYNEADGWVDQFAPPVFSKDGTAFLLILPQKQGDRGDWKHLVLVSNATAYTKTTALTSGTFVVTEIVSWDQENHFVYYLATSEKDPAQHHLYRVSLLDRNLKSKCLSCNAKGKSDGVRCLYNQAKFSPSNSHYVLTCAGPGVPDISICDKNSTKLFSWEDNYGVAELLTEKSLPIVKRLTVPVPGGFEAQIRLMIPPDADMSGSTKYPMLVYVYGGPDSNQVTEKFNIDWGTYLVTNKSIIYAAIDGRGSGAKGNKMLFAGYRHLGTVEIEDQISVTKYLKDKFPFIDRTRTAVWGWSYGGYAAGMILASDPAGVFKCGMSVAPVTDWALYDSIYTERFMGLPTSSDNLKGYEEAQLLKKVDKDKENGFRKKGYYLIHGTLDDNVHYQQSLMLAKVLEQKDILFRQQTYTDEDHGIAQSRSHLYHSLENFLDECFEPSS